MTRARNSEYFFQKIVIVVLHYIIISPLNYFLNKYHLVNIKTNFHFILIRQKLYIYWYKFLVQCNSDSALVKILSTHQLLIMKNNQKSLRCNTISDFSTEVCPLKKDRCIFDCKSLSICISKCPRQAIKQCIVRGWDLFTCNGLCHPPLYNIGHLKIRFRRKDKYGSCSIR